MLTIHRATVVIVVVIIVIVVVIIITIIINKSRFLFNMFNSQKNCQKCSDATKTYTRT